ncbi:MAG: hypothetical protein AABW75_01915 [Nanoarchaeota archaeon]
MVLRLWIRESDEELLMHYIDIPFEFYGEFKGSGPSEEILTGITEQTGLISRLKKSTVLGKIKYWEHEGSKQRIPFVRIDNSNRVYEHGLIMCPLDGHNVRFRGSRTVDKLTDFNRVELLGAQNNDFITKVFVTYYSDGLVPKPGDFEKHFLLYTDSRHLHNGRVHDFY